MYRTFFKPLVDRLMAILLLVLTSPILLFTAMVLALGNGGKIWFLQVRPGIDGKPFVVIKFRTMREAFDAEGNALPDAHRLTPVGRLVRRLSLDELPQLICVMRGEMSFVGPRPLLMEYLPLYNDRQRRRHDVRPGITGWAQVNGRNAVAWPQRFELDVWYVDHLSFGLDLKILILTVVNVITGRGISSPNAATMEKFRGND